MQQKQQGQSKSIGNYILGRTIGEGTFGKVKLGRHILSGANVAVKVLQKDRIVEVADVERVSREVHILKLIRHPHIVQLFEIIETRGQLYLIMEYASGGELFDYIVAKGRVPEAEACRFFHQIIAGVEKIHESHVVHRDLKPENLLLDENKCIKIVDFGLSNLFRDGQRLSTACGSPCYAPPEMVAGQQYVPQMCDLWSCGVILFALVCGYLPFEDQNTSALYKKILAADYQVPAFITDGVKDLIGGLLTADPQRRFTIKNVRDHAWYRQVPEASVQPIRDGGSVVLDEDVLHELEAYGFPRDYAVRCLELNKHNHITTTYYLLLERKKRVLDQLDADGNLGTSGSPNVAQGGSALQDSQQHQEAHSAQQAQYILSQQQQHPASARQPQRPTTPADGPGNGTRTPVPPSGYNGGRTPRPGQLPAGVTPRDQVITPRCETGRNSAQSRRVPVAAVATGAPRPGTSPNRRGDVSARGDLSARGPRAAGVCGADGPASVAATITTPRTQSPWRAQTPTHNVPHAYSARGRNAGGVTGAAAAMAAAMAVVPAGAEDAAGAAAPVSAPGAVASLWRSAGNPPDRPHAAGTPQPYSARGRSPVVPFGGPASGGGGAVGGADVAAGAGVGLAGGKPGQAGPHEPISVGGPPAGCSGVGTPGASGQWRGSVGGATTPQATPRAGVTPRTQAFTPRGQAATPRSVTPQGTMTYRQPHPPPQQALTSGAARASGALANRRRPPTTSQGVGGGVSGAPTVPVRSSATPTARIWR